MRKGQSREINRVATRALREAEISRVADDLGISRMAVWKHERAALKKLYLIASGQLSEREALERREKTRRENPCKSS